VPTPPTARGWQQTAPVRVDGARDLRSARNTGAITVTHRTPVCVLDPFHVVGPGFACVCPTQKVRLGYIRRVYGLPVSLLITVPVYGQHEYTHALVQDLEREGADYLIIDNRGDYPKLGGEQVIRPGENLGWTGGSDLGFRIGFSDGYSHVMTLNNDTRISKGFVAALLDPRLPDDTGIVGPLYDGGGQQGMLAGYDGPAAEYTAVPRYRKLSVLDGTALVLVREAWREVGGLDLRSFGRYGWASGLDLNLRVTRAGFGVYATEMAFINHFGGKTAHAEFGKLRYWLGGKRELRRGMRRVHAERWRQELTSEPVTLNLVG
jgi:GT2 family glycosyltransferase